MLFQAPINTFDHYKDSFQVKFFKKREEKKSDNCHRHYENDLAEQCCNFDVTPTFPDDDAQRYACSRNASKHVIFDPLLKQRLQSNVVMSIVIFMMTFHYLW